MVSRLCFGTLTMSPLQCNMSAEEGARLLIHAHEQGVNFLDTAELYDTYRAIALALREAPDYVISSKAYCYDEDTARASLERAFRETGRDYIDLFMLHEQESLYTLRGHERALRYLERQKEAGHLGAVGISTHHVAAVKAATWFGGIDVIHPLINAFGLGIADGTRQQMEEAISEAHRLGVGIFAMKPLGGGHLIGRAQEAFRYILEAPWVDSVATGMQSVEEIDCNVALFEGRTPEGALNRLAQRSRRLMIHDWCEGCGRCVQRCKQGALRVVEDRAQVDQARCVLCGYCASVCPQFCIKVI